MPASHAVHRPLREANCVRRHAAGPPGLSCERRPRPPRGPPRTVTRCSRGSPGTDPADRPAGGEAISAAAAVTIRWRHLARRIPSSAHHGRRPGRPRLAHSGGTACGYQRGSSRCRRPGRPLASSNMPPHRLNTSDYCWGTEVRRALDRRERREAIVIPVIVRPTDWHSAPFGGLQAARSASGQS